MIKYPWLKIKHIARNMEQRLFNSNIAIIGSYHGGNVGDMVLGKTIQKLLQTKGLKSDLQTLHNLEKWPYRSYAIVGGGAVGYNEALEKIYSRYKTHLDHVLLIGVDFNESLSDKSLELLNQALYVSCRSRSQMEWLKNTLTRRQVDFHPDIAFSYPIQETTPDMKHKRILINAIPLYGYFKNDKLVPEVQFQSERSVLYKHFDLLHANYQAYIKRIIKHYQSLGYIAESLPFTTEDDLYARIFFKDQGLRMNPYSSDIDRVTALMQNAEVVFSTRFHATIFSMRLRKQIIPIAYARKNEMLLNSVAMPGSGKYFTVEDFMQLPEPDLKWDYDRSLISEFEQHSYLTLLNVLEHLTHQMI